MKGLISSQDLRGSGYAAKKPAHSVPPPTPLQDYHPPDEKEKKEKELKRKAQNEAQHEKPKRKLIKLKL